MHNIGVSGRNMEYYISGEYSGRGHSGRGYSEHAYSGRG